MTTRQPKELREWKPKKTEDNINTPPMGFTFLEHETAAYYGKSIDEFRSVPARLRAEMIAHYQMKSIRDGYLDEQRKAKIDAKKGGRSKSGFNPMEAQQRTWMV